MKIWLLLQDTYDAMQRALQNGAVSAVQQQQYMEAKLAAMSAPGSSPGSRLLAVAGDTSRIEIKGVMTKDPDLLAFLFGGGNVTYAEIAAALAEAEANSAKRTELFIDSPGGVVDLGLETMALIRSHKKPISAIVTGTGASMAYGFASQTNKITATHEATQLGSVGIAAQIMVSDDVVTITSDAAPKKRPDPKTPEGQAAIKETLNAIHTLFGGAIAEGRSAATGKNIDLEHVNKNYGQGAVVLANKALEVGMIDEIKSVAARPHLTVVPTEKPQNQPTAGTPGTIGAKAMTKEELKAKHPDVYAAIQAEGAAGERDRVLGHLNMGATSGDMVTAVEAIKTGSGMTAELTSKYMSASIAKFQKGARTEEAGAGDPGSAAAVAGAEAQKQKDKMSDDVLAAVCQKLGVKNPAAAKPAVAA